MCHSSSPQFFIEESSQDTSQECFLSGALNTCPICGELLKVLTDVLTRPLGQAHALVCFDHDNYWVARARLSVCVCVCLLSTFKHCNIFIILRLGYRPILATFCYQKRMCCMVTVTFTVQSSVVQKINHKVHRTHLDLLAGHVVTLWCQSLAFRRLSSKM